MNNINLTGVADHLAWKQIVSKELGNRQRYVERAYADGFDKKKGPWKSLKNNLDNDEDRGDMFMPSSYPIPYTRTNLGPREMKKLPFFNDSTGFNPSDPSSL